jgi:serine/threonine protein kinase
MNGGPVSLFKGETTGQASETVRGDVRLAPLAPDLRTGTPLAGYRLEELIGRGGMGVVYRAEHLHLGRRVALKLLAPQFAADAGFRDRFVRESRIAASIHHANVVTVYDAGEAEGLLYIAMQYVEGTDLAAYLQLGALELGQALDFVGQIAAALDAAHSLGLVHRDVKPANVLIDRERCYLTDFGLTKDLSAGTFLSTPNQIVGTVEYMSPEQIEGAPVDARADVYALGCLLYHSLAGVVPFSRESQIAVIHAHLKDRPRPLGDLRPGLPEELDAVLARAMAKRPDQRYGRASEFVESAREALEEHPPPAKIRLLSRGPAATLLLAEDDPSVRAAVRGILGHERFDYAEATDASAAIEQARERQPGLILLDWELPGMPAPDVCRALRADPRVADTKIVVVARRGVAPDEETLQAAGADALLLRPLSSLQLQFEVANLEKSGVARSG